MMLLICLLSFLVIASAVIVNPNIRLYNQNDNNNNNNVINVNKPNKPKREVFVRPTKPDYNELESLQSSQLKNDPEFIKVCKEMAGYYIDKNKNVALKNVLLIAGVNNGYKEFLRNFKCHTDSLGIKFLPISLDEGIYKYITSNNISPTYLLNDIPGRDKVQSEPSKFGGQNFNLIGCRKMEVVAAALSLGYDVIFSDVDIGYISDPINSLFFPGIDYVHSTNKGCDNKWDFNEEMEGNTGFYSVQSNPRTIRTWDLTYKTCARAPKYDDQTMFWLVLRTNSNPRPSPLLSCPSALSDHSFLLSNDRIVSNKAYDSNNNITNKVVSCPLDNCQFSASNLREGGPFIKLITSLKNSKKRAIMAHANWISGKEKKKSAMIRAGLWMAKKNIDETWTCQNRGSLL